MAANHFDMSVVMGIISNRLSVFQMNVACNASQAISDVLWPIRCFCFLEDAHPGGSE